MLYIFFISKGHRNQPASVSIAHDLVWKKFTSKQIHMRLGRLVQFYTNIQRTALQRCNNDTHKKNYKNIVLKKKNQNESDEKYSDHERIA